MITKELLEAIFSRKVKLMPENTSLNPRRIDIVYMLDNQNSKSRVKAINIYELANLCKEWAYRYGYEIASYKLQDIHNKPYRCILAHNNLQLNRDMRYGFYADTEPDSIFLGCEYILEKIKEK